MTSVAAQWGEFPFGGVQHWWATLLWQPGAGPPALAWCILLLIMGLRTELTTALLLRVPKGAPKELEKCLGQGMEGEDEGEWI